MSTQTATKPSLTLKRRYSAPKPTRARSATAATGALGSARKTSRAASRMTASLRTACFLRPDIGPAAVSLIDPG